MRRKAGIGAVQKQKLEQERYKDKGTEIQENQLDQMTKQMEVLRSNLEDFASKHRHEIKKNPSFRKQFQDMCASIGVDPLASGKGFWSILNLGDFYYELSVQIVEVCLATSEKNGGLISLEELRDRLVKARGKNKQHQEINQDDLLVAAKKLRIFGNGFSIINVGKGKYMVQSVPGELSMEQTTVVSVAASLGNGYINEKMLEEKVGWESARSKRILDQLVTEGLAWFDPQEPGGPLYWFPSLSPACISSTQI